MKVSIENVTPNSSFWNSYSLLWEKSMDRSPFQAPHILQFFAGLCDTPPLAFQFFFKGELKGAALLMPGKKEYHFLSDLKTDHNFFVIHRDCTDEQVRMFFEGFLEKAKEEKWALLLNNQPGWARYMETFRQALRNSGLFWVYLPYSVCPVIEGASPEDLLAQMGRSKSTKYAVSRMKNQLGAEFEALTDDKSIDLWADQFCDAHIRRWANTPTPSYFRNPERIRFLKGCLHAWQRDGLLVRFSIRAGEQRIGFSISLRQGDRMVGHSLAFDPDFSKYSPGKALFYFKAEWMKDNGLQIFDFGDGNESYKYYSANTEHELSRIFISDPANMRFILKAKVIKFIRNNTKLFDFYREKIKPVTPRLQRIKGLNISLLSASISQYIFILTTESELLL